MSTEIIDFIICPDLKKIGIIMIKYHQLIIKCDLVYFSRDKRVWIRMPERWVTEEKKAPYCYWETKELSNAFQIEILDKLFSKYEMDLEGVKRIYYSMRKSWYKSDMQESCQPKDLGGQN